MTRPGRPARNRTSARPVARISAGQVVAVVVLVGLLIGAAVIGGAIGGSIIGVVALAAGALLALRWRALDPRIRILRLVAVLAVLAVAVSVFVRD